LFGILFIYHLCTARRPYSMKHFSNKTLNAGSRTQATYYANHSAKRYGQRYTSFKLQCKARSSHFSTQYRELRQRQPAFMPNGFTTWAGIAGRHKDKHNPHHIAVMEASRQREARRQEQQAAELSAAVNERIAAILIGN
jgi:hypothetical protein